MDRYDENQRRSVLPRRIVAMIAQDGWRPTHPAAEGAAAEREYRGLRVRVLSARKARAYRPEPDEVAIAIRGRAEGETALSGGFAEVLRLEFDDTGRSATDVESGLDNPQTLSDSQADQVAEFVVRNRARATLVVHCGAGVSRSRSLAAAVCEVLALPYEWTVVNDDVYQAVRTALRARLGIPGNAPELVTRPTEAAWAEFDAVMAEVAEVVRANGLHRMTDEELTAAAERAKQVYRQERRALEVTATERALPDVRGDAAALFARMQTPECRDGTIRGITATPEEMGRAAHAAADRDRDRKK